ncbi:UDP-galactose translocator-like [Gigantopelta aegis]|uniref:UDP-galactose translocator-like n=1 Tax=Gigantopelta aegis TaxID=1735272 RepID=UPI001B88866B|nr:UDP-galactose translocator-like [Gigantopelta aegis]
MSDKVNPIQTLTDDIGVESSAAIKMGNTETPEKHKQVYKYASLVVLTVQNALLILVMRYVRTRPGDMFLSTSAVVMTEVFKVGCSLMLILLQEGGVMAMLHQIYYNIIKQPLDCLKVCIPSIIYTVQNNLLYVAVSNLDAATFQVTYQLKILTTAIFSVILLHKHLSRLQWTSLVILIMGVSIIQLTHENTEKSHGVATEQRPFVGFVAVIISCIMSGFAGVYFEKILKGTPQSVWIRNVQLGTFGSVVGFITMGIKDRAQVAQHGMFSGYDGVVWFVICLQSFGGLMVAVVVKYADNILKGFATSAAIILSCIASIYFFAFTPSLMFIIGTSFVITAVYMYSKFAPTVPYTVNKI